MSAGFDVFFAFVLGFGAGIGSVFCYFAIDASNRKRRRRVLPRDSSTWR